jgi:hypothetical protein
MPFFGDNYTLRRFGEDKVVNGYPVAAQEDMTVFLDVQTISDDEIVEEGGSRDSMMLKTFGDFPIRCSKQEEGVRSDQLFYEGRWYECTASRLSKNTFIKHWTSIFALVPVSTEEHPGESEVQD